jgi:hypothetical protein
MRTSEQTRRMQIAEDALMAIGYGRWEEGPGRRRTLIATARRAIEDIAVSRRIEAEAERLCAEQGHVAVLEHGPDCDCTQQGACGKRA